MRRATEFFIGCIYEDCAFHPVLCTGILAEADGDASLHGVSLLDGSAPRSCSIRHCGPALLTLDEALAIREDRGGYVERRLSEIDEAESAEGISLELPFDGGALELRIRGYEIEQFQPGGLHDWLVGSIRLVSAEWGESEGAPADPAAMIHAFSTELSIGAGELRDLEAALGLALAGSPEDLALSLLEGDLDLMIHPADHPRVDIAARFGNGCVTFQGRELPSGALVQLREAVATILGAFPPRGES
jgi:hypothetical protein